VPARLVALTVAANDPVALARFWRGLLGWEPLDDRTLEPPDDTGFRLGFEPTPEPKTDQNRMHVDLTSATLDEQRVTVARALELGGRHCDVGQLPEEEHVVLADPEGNEFCVIAPGNKFLADCGFIGAVACDGSQEVGYFWSKALDWPLVWDQDQETAIRSPRGGPKITWGGPPYMLRAGRDRLRFDVAPSDGDQAAEIDRLVGLGATRIADGEAGSVRMTDPDGNEFRLLGPS
jgi:catechol 2,3-dioxygenase-like lactoylglutathione lyase family enzyme